MTKVEARAEFIAMCEAVEHAEPVAVRMDAPILVGGGLYRLSYDGQTDLVVMLPEKAWQERLAKARAAHRERVVDLPGNAEQVRICQGGREWVVCYDISVDEYLCLPSVKADR